MVSTYEGILSGIIFFLVLNMILKDMFGITILTKFRDILSFGKTSVKNEDKIETIKADTPDSTFNILEFDTNTGEMFYKKNISVEKNAYVENTEISPIIIKNEIPVNIPLRIFQKKLARDMTGFLWKIDYKLNPSATEILRVINMKILKTFLSSIKVQDYEKMFYIIIGGVVVILVFLYFYILPDIKDIVVMLEALLKANEIIIIRG